MRVAFVGLGQMGSAMAERLLNAGHTLIVYNRTAARAEPLVARGATRAPTPAEAVREADVVFTMLADDASVEHLVFETDGILGALRAGAVHVGSSTVSVACAQRLTVAHGQTGQTYVSAPVFGRPDAARAGNLFIAAAGPDDALDLLQPLFDAMGQRTYRFGATASAANVVKLAGNFMISSTIEALGEAFSLVRKSGVDVQAFAALLTTSSFTGPVHRTYSALLLEGDDDVAGFPARLALKDLRLIIGAAEAVDVPMPFASLVRDAFVSAIARGYAEHDVSVLGRVAAENAGIT
jgi:3-hydroxyisobutyrate dehydrogenase-like beta-hydroxyacid dehydrogenase